jgi:recombination protein RecR
MLSPIQRFIDTFSRLPSLGPRFATRLAFYIVSQEKSKREELVSALSLLNNVNRCEQCFFLKMDTDIVCDICGDKKRNPKKIAIVEKETDILSIERSHSWNGHYLVLGSLPEHGILETEHKLRLSKLKKRIVNELGGMADEIVIALNLTTFGDFVASVINEEFKQVTKHITRIGRGIPTGGEIEFADEETLKSALERRM